MCPQKDFWTCKQWWQLQRQTKNNFDRNEGIFSRWYTLILYNIVTAAIVANAASAVVRTIETGVTDN